MREGAGIVEEAVHVLGEQIIGQDPFQIEHLWQLMYRGSFYRGGAILCSAISGIEQALWDIKEKLWEYRYGSFWVESAGTGYACTHISLQLKTHRQLLSVRRQRKR